jgi:lipopolysaccharide export system protein LptA
MNCPHTLAAAALMALIAPMAVEAQERVCDFSSRGRTEQVDRGGTQLILLYDPFEVICTDGAVLRANSGTLNRALGEMNLVGNVFFEDEAQTLSSNNAIYNSGLGRLYATGDVVFRDRVEGSTLTGPELEYYRALPERPEAQVLARQRPHLTLQPRDTDPEGEPLEVDADQVMIMGQDRLDATGDVVITRPDMRATAAQADYDAITGGLDLRGDAAIVSEDYRLAGEVVKARLVEGAIEHVHARTNASLAGDRLSVTAPDLQLFFAEELLQRAVARGDRPAAPDSAGPDRSGEARQRAVAFSGSFRLESDSLEAMIPGQQLEQIVAIGNARGETIDTLTATFAATPGDQGAPIPAKRAAPLLGSDWISGDTIIGFFALADSVPEDSVAADIVVADTVANDTAGAAPAGEPETVLKRVLAKGSAQSLYRLAPAEDATDDRRGANFLVGDIIDLTFEEGELALADVTGLKRGLHLDPVPAAEPAPDPDATGAANDR